MGDEQKIIVEAKLDKPAPILAEQRPLPPDTTLEEDIRTQAQRDLNFKWEDTQAFVAKIVVITTCLGVLISLALRGVYPERIVAFPAEWWAILGLVIGFYFGRTNHARSAATVEKHAGPNFNPLDDRGAMEKL